MNKIRADFLKGLGITTPCPADYEYIAPIPDYQLLKAVYTRARKNGVSPGILTVRYGLRLHTIANLRTQQNKRKVLK